MKQRRIYIITYNYILESLPKEPRPCDDSSGIWSNGCDIMCEIAGSIAELLESMGVTDVASTGYFDPVEDKRNNEVDECTGFYYVTCE